MMLTNIDHGAFAVREIEAAIALYERACGATVAHRETVAWMHPKGAFRTLFELVQE